MVVMGTEIHINNKINDNNNNNNNNKKIAASDEYSQTAYCQ